MIKRVALLYFIITLANTAATLAIEFHATDSVALAAGRQPESRPHIAALRQGNIVTTWIDSRESGYGDTLYYRNYEAHGALMMRLFDNYGSPLGDEIVIDQFISFVGNNHFSPANMMAIGPQDNRINIFYTDQAGIGNVNQFVQYTSDGRAITAQRTYTPPATTRSLLTLDIKASADSMLHTLWSENTDFNADGELLYYQRSYADGSPRGPPILIAQSTGTDDKINAGVLGIVPDNSVIVFWTQGYSPIRAKSQKIVNGQISGQELAITQPSEFPYYIDIAVDRDRNAYYLWGNRARIYIRKYTALNNLVFQHTIFGVNDDPTMIIDRENRKIIAYAKNLYFNTINGPGGSNLRVHILSADDQPVYDGVLFWTASEAEPRLAEDGQGNVHVVYSNGIAAYGEIPNTGWGSAYHTQITPMKISVIGNSWPGRNIRIDLEDSEHPGAQYVLALALGHRGFSVGATRIPLDPDILFFTSVQGGIGVVNGRGTLDNNGRATVYWNIPPDAPIGAVIDAAFVTLHQGIISSSPSVRIIMKQGPG